MRVLQAVVRCQVAPLREVAPAVPEALARVVDRCLEKDLERRYGSAVDLSRDLAKLAECREEPVPGPVARPGGEDGRDARPAGRREWVWALAAGLAGLALGLAIGLVLG